MAALGLLAVLSASGAEEQGRWTVAGYLSGDGDLGAEAEQYLEWIVRGAQSVGWNAAVQIDRRVAGGGSAASRYLLRGADGEDTAVRAEAPEPGVNMGDGQTLARFLRWVREAAPGQRYALIIMGHGASVGGHAAALGVGLTRSGLAWDASSGGDALSAAELREAVASAGGERWLDALFLDCCFGGSLEVGYELKRCAWWLCAAPGEMSSPGVPWAEVLTTAGRSGAVDGEQLVRVCLETAARQAAGRLELVGLNLARMSEVAAALAELSRVGVPRMAKLAPSVTLARSRCRMWGGQRELCDAWQFAGELAAVTDSAEVRVAAQAVGEAIARAVVTGAGQTQGQWGPALFVPGVWGELPPEYRDGSLALATEGAWAGFVAVYVGRLRELILRAAPGGTEELGSDNGPGGLPVPAG